MRNHPGCLCLYATVMLSRDVRTETFSTHVTTQIAPDVREKASFTHVRVDQSGGRDEAVMKHCLFLPKISIFGHQNAGLV